MNGTNTSKKNYFTSYIRNIFWATILCKYHNYTCSTYNVPDTKIVQRLLCKAEDTCLICTELRPRRTSWCRSAIGATRHGLAVAWFQCFVSHLVLLSFGLTWYFNISVAIWASDWSSPYFPANFKELISLHCYNLSHWSTTICAVKKIICIIYIRISIQSPMSPYFFYPKSRLERVSFRVAPDTELTGYPAYLFCRISSWIVKGRYRKHNRLTFFQ